MMNKKEQIKITRKTKNFGWGYSTTPSGNGTDIAPPTAPDIEGSVMQVISRMSKHHNSQLWGSLKNVFTNESYFLNGKRIKFVSEWAFDDLVNGIADEATVEYR